MTQISNPVAAEGGELFDLGQGKLWLGFVLRSIRRHLGPFLATFLVIGLLGSLLALSGSKAFVTGSTLIARNDTSIDGITVPNLGVNPNEETPAELAVSTIKSQTSLEKLVDDLKLVERAYVGETKLGASKRRFFEAIFSKPTPEQLRRDLVSQLRSKLVVDVDRSERVKQTVNLGVTWSDGVIAKQIIDAAGQNFIDSRKKLEIGEVTVARDIALTQLKAQQDKVAKLRDELGVPEYDDRALPETSPLRGALNLENSYAERALDADTQLKNVKGSFDFRYRVATPAALPKSGSGGGLSSILISLIGAGLIAAFVTTLIDVLRGRVVEPWQVTKRLNLPLLADLRS
jgi:hypothetical protein